MQNIANVNHEFLFKTSLSFDYFAKDVIFIHLSHESFFFNLLQKVPFQPPLAAQMPNIPRSTFQFDFDFERRILAEAEKETQNWGKIAGETQPSKTAPTSMV